MKMHLFLIGALLPPIFLSTATGQTAVPATDRPDSSTFMTIRPHQDAYGLVPGESVLREQVTEALFAFVFTLTEVDSLGTWTADDLLAFGESWREESAFPVAEFLESITREELTGDQVINHRGARCNRRWLINLKPTLAEFPLPFSILGYHPGTLSINAPLVFNEWRLGARTVHVTVEGVTKRYEARGVTVWEVAAGWIVLDIDGWLDKLLGSAADDAATKGFTACWVDDELVGVGNSVSTKGRAIYGEFDFRTGEIENHGRAIARGISRFSQGWTGIHDTDGSEVWRAYKNR